MSEHIGQQAMLNAAQFNNVVEFQFKPTFIKVISGLWLLVAGRDSFMEVYSVHTLRRACVIQTQGRVLSAEGTREYIVIGVSTREVQFYSIRQMELVKTVHTLQPPTTMCLIQEKILVYGLGDEGYGCIFLKEAFRLFEQNSGKEKNKRAVAKTAMLSQSG